MKNKTFTLLAVILWYVLLTVVLIFSFANNSDSEQKQKESANMQYEITFKNLVYTNYN